MQKQLAKKEAQGLPRAFWFLWGGTLLSWLGNFVVPFFTFYLTAAHGVSISQAALVVSLFGAGSLFSNMCGGLLADHLGRRITMVGGMMISAGLTLALGLIPSLTGIMLLAPFYGFFNYFYRPAANAAVADLVPSERRVRAYGLIYWAINIGASVAVILAGFLARISYLILFAADAGTTFLFALCILWGVPETRPGGPRADVTSGKEKASLRGGLGIALRDPLLLGYTLLGLVFASIYLQHSVTLPLDMRAHGLTAAQYGIALACNGILIVILTVPLNHFVLQRAPRALALAIAALLIGIGFGLNGLISTLPLYGLSVVIWTFGEMVNMPTMGALIADLSPKQYRGTYQGVIGTSWGIAALICPALGGLVLQQTSSLVLWTGCFVLGALVAAGHLLLAGPLRRRMAQLAKEHDGGT